MFKEFVVNLKDMMRSGILRLREFNGKLKEGLCDPKKVVNLAPFLVIKH